MGVQNAGKAAVQALVAASFKYAATGSGTTAESAAHTALVTENTLYGSARADCSSSPE